MTLEWTPLLTSNCRDIYGRFGKKCDTKGINTNDYMEEICR